MSKKKVDLGGLTIGGAKLAVGLDDLVASVTLSWATEQVAELAIESYDTGGRLAKTALGTIGSSVTYKGDPWTVSAVDTDWADDNVTWTFRNRSKVTRKLRRKVKVSAERKQSPAKWVTGRVTAAGGRAICQNSATMGVIAQGKDQTELDIVSDLAGQLGWSWTEWGGTFLFGSRHWAWTTGVPGMPTYAVTWDTDIRTDALTATGSQTEDDSISTATMSLTLPYAQGQRLRPWYRLRLNGFGRYDGVWLIESVTVRADGVTPVEVEVMQPKKIAAQPAGGKE